MTDTSEEIVERLRELEAALKEHHDHLLHTGPIGLPDGDGGWIEIDNGAEYSDSLMYERTVALLCNLPPEAAGPMPRGGIQAYWWQTAILERRKRKAAEKQVASLQSSAADARRVALEEAAKVADRTANDALIEDMRTAGRCIALVIRTLASQSAPCSRCNGTGMQPDYEVIDRLETCSLCNGDGKRGRPDASQPAPAPEGRASLTHAEVDRIVEKIIHANYEDKPRLALAIGRAIVAAAATPEVRQMPGVEAEKIAFVALVASHDGDETLIRSWRDNNDPRFTRAATAILSLFPSGVKK